MNQQRAVTDNRRYKQHPFICNTKTPYEDEDTANHRARELSHLGKKMYAYFCPKCNCYYLSRSST